jgi:hypothetical protein
LAEKAYDHGHGQDNDHDHAEFFHPVLLHPFKNLVILG